MWFVQRLPFSNCPSPRLPPAMACCCGSCWRGRRRTKGSMGSLSPTESPSTSSRCPSPPRAPNPSLSSWQVGTGRSGDRLRSRCGAAQAQGPMAWQRCCVRRNRRPCTDSLFPFPQSWAWLEKTNSCMLSIAWPRKGKCFTQATLCNIFILSFALSLLHFCVQKKKQVSVPRRPLIFSPSNVHEPKKETNAVSCILVSARLSRLRFLKRRVQCTESTDSHLGGLINYRIGFWSACSAPSGAPNYAKPPTAS